MRVLLQCGPVLLAIVLVACGRGIPVIQETFDPNVYVVQSGDTVYSIAWRHGKDFRDMILWNELHDPYTIYPGQKLLIRKPFDQSSQKAAITGRGNTRGPSGSTAASKPPAPKEPSGPAANGATKKGAGKTQVASRADLHWVWPAKGALLSRFSSGQIDRQGIDIKGVEGDTVSASRGGKVVYSGSGLRTYGRLIIIKHSEIFLSAYAHNSQLLVREGDTVKIGQPIARIGLSNQAVAKLHFEIRENGKPVNPLKYLPTR